MWYLSLAAEALLLWTLGARSPWGRYLAFDLLRAAVLSLLAVRTVFYAWAWLGSEMISLALQFLAVGHVITANVRCTDARLPRWLLYAGGAVAIPLSFLLADSPDWRMNHHVLLMLRRLSVAVLLGALFLAEVVTRHAALPPVPLRHWMLAYYALQAASVVAVGIAGPGFVRPLNTIHAAVVGVLFIVWASCRLSSRIPGTARPR